MTFRTCTVFTLWMLTTVGCGGGRPEQARQPGQVDEKSGVAEGKDAWDGEGGGPVAKSNGEPVDNGSDNGGHTTDPVGIPESYPDVAPTNGDGTSRPRVEYSRAAPEMAAAPLEYVEPDDWRVWKEGEQYKTVTIYYGTDRARTYDDIVGAGWMAAHYSIPGLAVVLGLIASIVLAARSQKFIALMTLVLAIGGGVLFVKFVPLNLPMRLLVADKGIPKYGPDRGKLETGICKVTIPRTHTAGNVERPDIRRFEINEDVRKHVVLDDVQPLQDEAFYQQLRSAVERSPRRDLFLFVHGYNVTFEKAALRTGQMAFDLEFDGAAVFYSWPSQGVEWRYTVDETNVKWSTPHLKQFLLDIVKHSGAKSINLIAHSMGNRALTNALDAIERDLKDDALLFNQLILAAPDIDADTFKTQIAPVIQKTARRTTLYASSGDQALVASRRVHGHPRAGESGPDLLILPGIHTIDVSEIKSDVLGHSYYASSDLVLTDLKELFRDVGPTLRRWLKEVKHDGLTYWVYEKARARWGPNENGPDPS